MRPRYESERTLELERMAITKFADEFSVTPVKLPIAYNIDYALLSGENLMCWAEVKCRDVERYTYDTLAISMKKIVNGVQLSKMSGKSFLLLVQWNDSLGWIKVKEDDELDIRLGGRKGRNDWQDVEPMAHFDVRQFKIIGG